MERRDFLTGGLALGLVPALTGEALAARTRPLGERLENLDVQLHKLATRDPAPRLRRGMSQTGLRPRVFQNVLAGLLVAEVYNASTPQEQADPRWRTRLEGPTIRFTRDLAALMTWYEGRRGDREARRLERRMLRRPNRMARVIELSLAGKTTDRNRELRRAMAGVSAAADDGFVEDAIDSFDGAAAKLGTTRAQLAGAPANAGEGKEEQDYKRTRQDQISMGAFLFFGGAAALGLGIMIGSTLGGAAIALCLIGVILMVLGLGHCCVGGGRPKLEEEGLDEVGALDRELELLLAAA